MALIIFSDILKKAGLNPSNVKLIRHALTDKGFKSCYDKNMVLEYTCQQKKGFSKGYKYWAVFISDNGNYAKLYALYKVGNSVPDTHDMVPLEFPHPEWFKGENSYFDLQYVDYLQEYEGRLIIDWGKSTRMWHQKGTTEKPVIAIESANKQAFPGYENIIISYDKLKEVIDNYTDYELWHTALASINAIYLIVDTENGKQYIGSAYGQNGLLGRWSCYVDSLHGNNKSMMELICNYPERYHYFQFSILQILPKNITNDEVIKIESLWKRKLRTLSPFGMNNN
ncbi:GIY-YIG nuclease family protein [Paraclostridium bifermentans]|uniref:GIY-YIG nuclease family protein n=1 Tax=Paraclostridium bifermentans TaxID=1490 RepID=UPI00242B2F84|nr:GIY-YIG nuclease family protein [Paraclostridium bifermentans]